MLETIIFLGGILFPLLILLLIIKYIKKFIHTRFAENFVKIFPFIWVIIVVAGTYLRIPYLGQLLASEVFLKGSLVVNLIIILAGMMMIIDRFKTRFTGLSVIASLILIVIIYINNLITLAVFIVAVVYAVLKHDNKKKIDKLYFLVLLVIGIIIIYVGLVVASVFVELNLLSKLDEMECGQGGTLLNEDTCGFHSVCVGCDSLFACPDCNEVCQNKGLMLQDDDYCRFYSYQVTKNIENARKQNPGLNADFYSCFCCCKRPVLDD